MLVPQVTTPTHNWVAAVFRIIAVWIAVETLIAVPGFIASWYSTMEDPAIPTAARWPPLVSLASSFAGAVLLWSASDRLSSVIWRDDSRFSAAKWNLVKMQLAAFRAIGAYLIVVGIPDLLELAAGYYTLPTGFGLETTYSGRLWARALGVGFQVVFGSMLLLRADLFARFWVDHRREQHDSIRARGRGGSD